MRASSAIPPAVPKFRTPRVAFADSAWRTTRLVARHARCNADAPCSPSLALLMLLAGCATTARFADRPVLWRDPDDLPIARPRAPLPAGIQWTGFRDAVVFPADRV
jgi:hypothetical protein